jgi:hypothetical protein
MVKIHFLLCIIIEQEVNYHLNKQIHIQTYLFSLMTFQVSHKFEKLFNY